MSITKKSRPAGRLVALAAATFALAVALVMPPSAPAHAADAMSVDDVYKDIEQTFGFVPSFAKKLPKAALRGAWQEEKDLELSDQTALSPKVKALISLAVSAQVPCRYCIWMDTNTARQFGASDEEIGEAVAMAALTRHWSTLFNGLQVDFDTFKKELGGDAGAQ